MSRGDHHAPTAPLRGQPEAPGTPTILTICNVCTLNLRQANKKLQQDSAELERTTNTLAALRARPCPPSPPPPPSPRARQPCPAGGSPCARPPGRLGPGNAGALPRVTRACARPLYRLIYDPDGRPFDLKVRRSF